MQGQSSPFPYPPLHLQKPSGENLLARDGFLHLSIFCLPRNLRPSYSELEILTLLLISCVFLGLSLYLSEALPSHHMGGWVIQWPVRAFRYWQYGLYFPKSKCLHMIWQRLFCSWPPQIIYLKSLTRSTKMKTVNSHYVGPFHVFSFNDRAMRLLKSGKGGAGSS